MLESGFDIDTGRSAQGNRLFGRQAYVGLQGDFGAITMGRQQNALFDLFGAYDPMSVAGVYSLNAVDNQFNGRADNALKYTGKFGGLTATGFYSFGRDANVGLGGEVPGSFKVGTNFGGAWLTRMARSQWAPPTTSTRKHPCSFGPFRQACRDWCVVYAG